MEVDIECVGTCHCWMDDGKTSEQFGIVRPIGATVRTEPPKRYRLEHIWLPARLKGGSTEMRPPRERKLYESLRQRYGALPARERVVVIAVAAAITAAALYVLWASWSLITSYSMAKSAATQARQATTEGNNQQLQEAAAALETAANRVNSVTSSPPVWAAAKIPYVGRTFRDLRYFSDASVEATQLAAQVAPAVNGSVYQDQRVNLESLDAVLAALPQTQGNLQAMADSLSQIQGDGIGGSSITRYRNDALAGVATLNVAATELAPNRQDVLRALGSDGPRNYLVPLLNNAELRASGGAPLSAAVVQINDGKLTVPFNGYIGIKAFDGHPRVKYRSAEPVACQPSPRECAVIPLWGAPDSGLSFVASNAHPDWRIAGDDLHRAWNASQPLKVDGVLALDTRAIASLLRIVGPIQTSAYGEVTEDNFEELVLQGAYDKFADDQRERQGVNDEIGQAVITKLLSGNTATMFATTSQLVQEAPGRNVQAWFASPPLEEAAMALGMGGDISGPQGDDLLGIYSRNRNASKVDVYSERNLTMGVQLATDGSAQVRQVLDVRNGATEHGNSADKFGYQANRSANDWFFVLPIGATNAHLTAPAGYDKTTVHPDGFGHQILATTGTIPAGDRADLVVTYTLPAGTFSTAEGLDYRLDLNPQPLQSPMGLTVNVSTPGAGCVASPQWDLTSGTAQHSGSLTRVEKLWINCRK